MAAALAVAACVAFIPAVVRACGPYFRVAVFVTPQPENPQEFADGKLGVIRPTYSKENLLVAYRILHDAPLTATEKQALSGTAPATRHDDQTAQRSWLKMRNTVPGRQQLYYLSNQKEIANYQFFINCNDDAFKTATATLQQLITQYGASGPAVKEWTDAQDIVFGNCNKGTNAPADPPDSMSPVLRADRLYQIAAANFYAGYYDAAAEQFTSIAKDKTSPWHDYGLLLAARCYIRKSTMGPLLAVMGTVQTPSDTASLERARRILEQVVSDPSLAKVQASAQRLIAFIDLHMHPHEREAALAEELAKPSNDPQFAQNVIDYFYLSSSDQNSSGEMAKWINDVRSRSPKAIEEWKKKPQSPAWLVAALMTANGQSPDASALVEAALKVPSGSPAYATTRFHAARLELALRHAASAHELIDTFLAHAKNLPLSSRNEFLSLRLDVANTLDDFVRNAAMQPVAISWDDGSNDPNQDECDTARPCNKLMIESAAAKRLDHMPLAMLLRIAKMPGAPLVLRRTAALVAWERGVLLNDFSVANAAAGEDARLDKQDAGELADFLKAQSLEAKRFAAAFVMLHWPGAQPSFFSSSVRDEPMRSLDNYRRNWWCKDFLSTSYAVNGGRAKATDGPYPVFLTAREKSEAQKEVGNVSALETAPNYLSDVVVKWAHAHPNDPRVPEALYLAVRATRYGCTDDATTRYSKTAFELLHQKYPGSEWTRKTPYYF